MSNYGNYSPLVKKIGKNVVNYQLIISIYILLYIYTPDQMTKFQVVHTTASILSEGNKGVRVKKIMLI